MFRREKFTLINFKVNFFCEIFGGLKYLLYLYINKKQYNYELLRSKQIIDKKLY